ncbi:MULTISPECIES: DUF3322 domain-containing protein [Corynebacterium]|uniref:DUF3322 domain-containing protein n=1 Tax=Corynebacterium TaxID=1716 RepID=UPI0003B7F858|nr:MULTISPECIES: DUF3322 domain-containing protein [unclassified Corynebacterium]ERS60684.1 hypothetical protein HMPREF1261_00348 [Corynebacterium sp. KPL1818]MDK8702844.1 DUF3322 domain-containing protein [Corynebacterium sp. MSK107]MDK8705451.1 DUF3322 domain-containing protein [Corynebacterium sp. MSK090]MDK8786454.1 DUF3322 domain-containing protein [Corynebacterium sp. MSK156]
MRRASLLSSLTLPAFAHIIHRTYFQWRDLSTYDLRRLAPCLTWLHANPDSSKWERGAPVEGVDGKWIGPHRRLLITFIAPFGIMGLGFRRSDTRLRLCYFNHAPALPDIEVPLAPVRLFPGAPPHVLIVENKQTFLTLLSLSAACRPPSPSSASAPPPTNSTRRTDSTTPTSP